MFTVTSQNDLFLLSGYILKYTGKHDIFLTSKEALGKKAWKSISFNDRIYPKFSVWALPAEVTHRSIYKRMSLSCLSYRILYLSHYIKTRIVSWGRCIVKPLFHCHIQTSQCYNYTRIRLVWPPQWLSTLQTTILLFYLIFFKSVLAFPITCWMEGWMTKRSKRESIRGYNHTHGPGDGQFGQSKLMCLYSFKWIRARNINT